MCFSQPEIPKPIPPAPPVAPMQAPILDAQSNKGTDLNQVGKQRLGKKALQIPLTKVTQSGLSIPTKL